MEENKQKKNDNDIQSRKRFENKNIQKRDAGFKYLVIHAMYLFICQIRPHILSNLLSIL